MRIDAVNTQSMKQKIDVYDVRLIIYLDPREPVHPPPTAHATGIHWCQTGGAARPPAKIGWDATHRFPGKVIVRCYVRLHIIALLKKTEWKMVRANSYQRPIVLPNILWQKYIIPYAQTQSEEYTLKALLRGHKENHWRRSYYIIKRLKKQQGQFSISHGYATVQVSHNQLRRQ